jgi:regulator of nonsense transcripts 2
MLTGQLYVVCKGEMPMDVNFMLSDILQALRPKAKRLVTFAEAAAAIDELVSAQATGKESPDVIQFC